MAEPTLLFCIGAPKSGTTWLYRYLRRHPDCHMPVAKELHYFCDFDDRQKVLYVRMTRDRIAMLKQRLKDAPLLKRRRLSREIEALEQMVALDPRSGDGHRAYLEHLCSGRGSRRLIADITPCYAMLDRTRLAEMAELMPDVRFVFLMRDPLDRAWSQARMNARRQPCGGSQATAEEMLRRFVDGENQTFVRRCDYARTLTELEATLPPERVFLGFYEDLFSDAEIFRLNDFLGIRRLPGDYSTVHLQGQSLKISAGMKQRALAALREQYDYCSALFGEALPKRWRQNMMEMA